MHYVGQVDWSFTDQPAPASSTSMGLSRLRIVGPDQGAVHTEAAVGALAAGGWLGRHIHSFEEALYVLAGELTIDIDGHVHRLLPGDYAHMAVGTWHALANATCGAGPLVLGQHADAAGSGRGAARHVLPRWPARRRRPGGTGRPSAASAIPRSDRSVTTTGRRRRPRRSGSSDPARGRAPAGMDVAILAYSGISVKMLVDRTMGADLLTMFTVDYEPNGAAQVHDHPFEEVYFFLDGEIEGVLDGEPHTLHAGDVAFAGVGSTHGFFNTGGGRVRWIETQAPQPPARHAYRWIDAWKRFEEH